MDFGGMDLGGDFGTGLGIGNTGFSASDAANAVGGLVDSMGDNPSIQNISIPSIPDDRSLMEKAAGWAVSKVEGKIQNMLENPITTAINTAFSAVPAVGAFNSAMGAFGLPTVGQVVTGIGRAIADGDITPGLPEGHEGAYLSGDDVSNSEVDHYRELPTETKYFRYRNGSIGSYTGYVAGGASNASDPVVAAAENANYVR